MVRKGLYSSKNLRNAILLVINIYEFCLHVRTCIVYVAIGKTQMDRHVRYCKPLGKWNEKVNSDTYVLIIWAKHDVHGYWALIRAQSKKILFQF